LHWLNSGSPILCPKVVYWSLLPLYYAIDLLVGVLDGIVYDPMVPGGSQTEE